MIAFENLSTTAKEAITEYIKECVLIERIDRYGSVSLTLRWHDGQVVSLDHSKV